MSGDTGNEGLNVQQTSLRARGGTRHGVGAPHTGGGMRVWNRPAERRAVEPASQERAQHGSCPGTRPSPRGQRANPPWLQRMVSRL